MRISRVVYPTPNTPSLEEDIRRGQEGANGFTWYPLPLSHVLLDVLCILLSLYMYFTSHSLPSESPIRNKSA